MRALLKSSFPALALALLMAAGSAGRASALSLDFTPATQSTTVGGQAVVDVWLRGLNGVVIGAYDITLAFDPAVLGLAANPVSFGLGLGAPLDSLPSILKGAGSLGVAEVSLLTNVNDLAALQAGSADLLLFTLSFVGLKEGSSAVSYALGIVADAAGNPAKYDVTFAPVVDVQPGQNIVPEPGTLLLLGLGLLGLLGLKRRSSARRG